MLRPRDEGVPGGLIYKRQRPRSSGDAIWLSDADSTPTRSPRVDAHCRPRGTFLRLDAPDLERAELIDLLRYFTIRTFADSPTKGPATREGLRPSHGQASRGRFSLESVGTIPYEHVEQTDGEVMKSSG